MQIPLSLSALKSNTKMGRILAPESDSAFFNAYPKRHYIQNVSCYMENKNLVASIFGEMLPTPHPLKHKHVQNCS